MDIRITADHPPHRAQIARRGPRSGARGYLNDAVAGLEDLGWVLLFVFAGAEHEVLDGFAGVFALVEDELHLLGDGHLDVVAAGESEGGAGGEDAFRHFAAEALENIGEGAALA